MKPGWKTSEFWFTFATNLLGGFMASGILPSDHVAAKIAGLIAATLATMGYSVSRGMAKKQGDQ